MLLDEGLDLADLARPEGRDAQGGEERDERDAVLNALVALSTTACITFGSPFDHPAM